MRNVILGVVSALILLFPLYSEAGAQKKIGVIVFSEETRYNDAARGMTDAMKESGFGEPRVKFIRENAGGNRARAAELVEEFKAAGMDVIFTTGTLATVAVAREIKNVPIVFSMVYDPVESGIAKEWKSSHNNTTGVSSIVPMTKIIEKLSAFQPVKRLAVLYAPGEKNSEQVLKDLQRVKCPIKIIPVPITRKEYIAGVLPEVIRTSDAIYITGSNLIDSEVGVIVDMATAAKVITITHLEDLVNKGVLLGVCPNPYRIGNLAGKKVVKILKGAKPSDLAIDTLKDYDVLVNVKTAKAGLFQIPPQFLSP